MKSAPHTLKIFDEDLELLRALVSELGGCVESAIFDAVAALVQRDEGRARAVLDSHGKIVALAAEVDRRSVQLIALRCPLADDLREVLAALKIAGSIARMGEAARSIARRTELLGTGPRFDQLTSIAGMAQPVLAMVKAALDAFVARDSGAAPRLAEMDDTVDAYNACIFRSLIEEMMRDPRRITAATHLLIVSQKLERTADHAVSIAGQVHFAATGEPWTAPPPSPPPEFAP